MDSRQKIYNGLNETIEIERDLVNPDRRVFCAEGLHVGSFDYAKDFGERVLIVKLSPADVICVPLDCSCQKMRVAKYSVISEIV